MSERCEFPERIERVACSAAFGTWMRSSGTHSLKALTDRGLGHAVTDHRSSWVRRINGTSVAYYIKTYDYPTWGDRWRGLGRNTALAPSRARQEIRALNWLRNHGFNGPEPVALGEERCLGFLRRAVVVTAAWPGHPLDELLPKLDPPEQAALLRDLQRFVTTLHAAGFCDGNLDLRNLLANRRGDGWTFAKIDSPKWRLLTPRPHGFESDWSRLTASLEAIDLHWPARPSTTAARAP